jgi:hypothetical protein
MSHFAAFVRTLLLLTAIAFAERAVFAGYHADLGAGLALWQISGALAKGLRFDLAIAAMLTFAVYFPAYASERLLRLDFVTTFRRLTYLAAVALVLIHGADLLYFDEAGRHLGYEIKEAYQSGSELIGAAFTAYTWQVMMQLGLLSLACAAVYVVMAGAGPGRRMFAPQKRWYHHFAAEGNLLGVFLAAAVLARGGLQSVPLEPLHAQTLGDPKAAALALNGAYNAVFSLATPYSVERVMGASPTDEQRKLVAALYASAAVPAARAGSNAPPPNVVIVFLESWSASHMGSYGSVNITTPFFDELRSRSLTTREMLAGGHRTTEGMFATLCSAQNPLGATVAQSQLQNYRYDCLPGTLKARGYHTAFFQGTVSGTSGTGAFAQLLGFEQSYGKEHVARHRLPHNNWGLHDPDLYEFALEKMGSLPRPFLVGINTN